MSKVDALYEAAQKQAVGPWRVGFNALADPQTVMALVEAYRAAKEHMLGDWESWHDPDLTAAIEKIEALG